MSDWVREDGYTWNEVQAGKPYRDYVDSPIDLGSLSDFGETVGERRERLENCVDHYQREVANLIDFYDDMGWSHGQMPIDRPLRSERDLWHYQNLLGQVQ